MLEVKRAKKLGQEEEEEDNNYDDDDSIEFLFKTFRSTEFNDVGGSWTIGPTLKLEHGFVFWWRVICTWGRSQNLSFVLRK